MVQLAVLMTAVLLMGSSVAGATTLFTFTGENDLAGEFVLDETAPFTSVTQTPDEVSGFLLSPLVQTIHGHFGAYTFHGIVTLHIFDRLTPYPPSSFDPPDFWIVRALPPNLGTLSGPEINGVSPTSLGLFLNVPPDVPIGLDVTPPPPCDVPLEERRFCFQYTVGFSDGSIAGGALTSLTLVPEPATFYYVALGFGAIMLGIRRLM